MHHTPMCTRINIHDTCLFDPLKERARKRNEWKECSSAYLSVLVLFCIPKILLQQRS